MTAGTTRLELLSPARDLACGIAAINHGADAVYIGAPKFGARAAAGNPLADIARLIAHAHEYWARVYITLNTILYDNELDEAERLVHQLYDAGADALIIQDMGLLELDLPPIPLFASTQAHNYDLERIRFLEQVGIQRVILARELTLKQVREIRAATSLELEFFVHGALCVSFSGQCYFSQAVKGRSANRGECAQMCRLPYSVVDARGTVLAQNQHVLSLKDLNLSDVLGELIDAGVTSFKIEGRLKDVAYVRNITSFYRAKLDALIDERPSCSRASSGRPLLSFAPDPSRTFSRGYTEYFLHGRKKGIVSVQTPKSLGQMVGAVHSVEGDSFTFRNAVDLHNGDGVCFFNENDELVGTNINQVEGTRIIPNSIVGIAPGTVLYRNHDHAFLQALKTDRAERTIMADMVFAETHDGFELRLVDEDGNAAFAQVVHPREPARKPEAMRETLRVQLTRLGDSIYQARGMTLETASGCFVPTKVLNKLRRDAVAALDLMRFRSYPRRTVQLERNEVPYPAASLDYSANVTNRKAEQFYRRHGVQQIEPGFELQKDHTGTLLMTTRHCLKYQFDLCKGIRGDSGALFLVSGTTRYKLEFDCERCVMKIVA